MDGEQNRNLRRNIIKAREERNNIILQQLREKMNPEELRANDLNRMKGASSWLTMLPLRSENFLLKKREFYDALSLRYRWTLRYLPSFCPCGKKYDVGHAMSCMKGGFIYSRHDDVRDMLASLLKDVCHDVQVEPHLETLMGEVLPGGTNSSDEARLHVSERGFWQRGQRTFYDVRVFNSFAKSYLNQKLDTAFRSDENEKKRQYNQRVTEVEHSSFTPLISTPYGGNGREAERFIVELALKLSEKEQLQYSMVMHWLRAKLSFNLLRSAVLCIRGSRTIKKEVTCDIANIEISNAVGTFE